jgi:hypothetical protein
MLTCPSKQSYCPHWGHYENPDVAHCVAVALFHGPGAVGVMYPNYFVEMPLPVVMFALAIVSYIFILPLHWEFINSFVLVAIRYRGVVEWVAAEW